MSRVLRRDVRQEHRREYCGRNPAPGITVVSHVDFAFRARPKPSAQKTEAALRRPRPCRRSDRGCIAKLEPGQPIGNFSFTLALARTTASTHAVSGLEHDGFQ